MNFEKFLYNKPRNFNHRRMSYVFEEDDGDERLTDSDVEKNSKNPLSKNHRYFV